MPPLTFAETWPAMSDRLGRTLTARGVPTQDRDDVIQETGLRVYRAWAGLDPHRPAWPFVITVALNVWRDLLRERAGRPTRDLADHVDLRDELDVERAVLARQELASVGAAFRGLPPEQRQLLLATEELEDVVRPLRPAERVARMRVRRQLARAIGRASAVVALIWIRRPLRSATMLATAYGVALAAAVFTVPAAAPAFGASAPAPPALRHVPGPTGAQAPGHVAGRGALRRPAASAPLVVARTSAEASLRTDPTSVPPASVCSPARPSSLGGPAVEVHIPSAAFSPDQAQHGRQRPQQVTTPDVDVHGSSGCVDVSRAGSRSVR